MDRLNVIQTLIDKRNFKSYLEIGVLGGEVFFKVKCRYKCAVDPEFKFNWKGRLGQTLAEPSNLRARFYETTSDDFFANSAAAAFQDRHLDIALIDGMHEFDFVNRDVINSLDYLTPRGILVLHDCNPQTAAAASSFNEWNAGGRTGYWNGDVWKTILYLRSSRNDLDVFVADCDHGLGIISRRTQPRETTVLFDYENISKMTYRDLDQNRTAFLNLKPVSFLEEYMAI